DALLPIQSDHSKVCHRPTSGYVPIRRTQARGLVYRRTGLLSQFAPAGDFRVDKMCEVLRRFAADHADAADGKTLPYLRRFQDLEQRGVELVDYWTRGSGGYEDPLPGTTNHLWIARFREGRHLRQGVDAPGRGNAERLEATRVDETHGRR